MTTALPAQPTAPDAPLAGVRPLRLVDGTAHGGPEEHGPVPLVGYLMLIPEGTDPARLFAEDVTPPSIRPIAHLDPPPVREAGDDAVRIDAARRAAALDGRELDLTYLEFGLLSHLVLHPHRVHSRRQLMASVWGYDHFSDGRTVDVHVARLRRKLGDAHRHRIVTVRRVGYMYVSPRQAGSGSAASQRL